MTIEELEAQIAEQQARLDELINQRNSIIRENLNKIENIEERFYAWAKSPLPNQEEEFLVNICSSSKKDLWQAYDADRHQKITCKYIADFLHSYLRNPQEIYYSGYEFWTRQDAHEWMIKLMEENIKSIIYDW